MSELQEQLPCYVVAADQDDVEIKCPNNKLHGELTKIGFAQGLEPGVLSKRVSTDQDKIAIFRQLQQLDFAFAGASAGWSPCDLFHMWAEQGHLSLPFKSIYWSGPGQWQVKMETKAR